MLNEASSEGLYKKLTDLSLFEEQLNKCIFKRRVSGIRGQWQTKSKDRGPP